MALEFNPPVYLNPKVHEEDMAQLDAIATKGQLVIAVGSFDSFEQFFGRQECEFITVSTGISIVQSFMLVVAHIVCDTFAYPMFN